MDSLRTYGATVDELRAPFGGTVPLADIEAALKAKKYRLVTFTHVDTSTGEWSSTFPCRYCALMISRSRRCAV